MNDDETAKQDQSQRNRQDRVIALIALVGILAAVIWRFVAPWTGLHADVAFIVVIVLGLLAAARLKGR
jgi:Flp pilus assembly protein TadB